MFCHKQQSPQITLMHVMAIMSAPSDRLSDAQVLTTGLNRSSRYDRPVITAHGQCFAASTLLHSADVFLMYNRGLSNVLNNRLRIQ